LDLLDQDAARALLDEFSPDSLVHCAALANLDACETQPDLARHLNADLPGFLAAEASQREVRFVHISTDAVFDGQKGEYTEEDAPHPLSVYARTKLAGEEAVLAANPGAVIVRTVFFGWSLSGQRSLAEHFYNCLSAGKTMPGHTDRFFSPLLVNTLAAFLLNMLENNLHGTYHAVSSDHVSKADFGLAIADRFSLDAELIQPIRTADAGLKAARAPRLTLRGDKLAKALAAPLPTVADGVQDFYELYQQGYPARLRDFSPEPAAVEN
jgi:dTDP-4-dehydrorhamnose reductase